MGPRSAKSAKYRYFAGILTFHGTYLVLENTRVVCRFPQFCLRFCPRPALSTQTQGNSEWSTKHPLFSLEISGNAKCSGPSLFLFESAFLFVCPENLGQANACQAALDGALRSRAARGPYRGLRRIAHHTPLLKIPVWWRRAVLPSLPWLVCFFPFLKTPAYTSSAISSVKEEVQVARVVHAAVRRAAKNFAALPWALQTREKALSLSLLSLSLSLSLSLYSETRQPLGGGGGSRGYPCGGVPWPAAGADFLWTFFFFAIFYLFSWEFAVLAAMLSRLATACRPLLNVPCCTIDHLHSSWP